MTKVIIAGCRDFEDYDLLYKECNTILDGYQDIEIVSGGAKGADKLGERFAEEKNYSIKQFKPNWKFGKGAGAIRNKEMVSYANLLIAFWDGKSRGTKHIIEYARNQKDITVRVIKY